MVIAGALAGAEFPLATKESSPRAYGEISGRAGSLYALDLGGAFIGTLLVGVVLVPWIGIPCTLLLAGVLKAVSLFYLCLAR
jgi:predicted membrane-bound spermidine synthase